MAYYVGRMVSGLCIHTSGRKQDRDVEDASQSSGCMAPDRTLAWRQLELYFVGSCPFPDHCHRKTGTLADPGEIPYSGTFVYGFLDSHKLADIRGRGSSDAVGLSDAAVSVSGRILGGGIFRRLSKIRKNIWYIVAFGHIVYWRAS